MSKKLVKAIADMREEEALKLVREMMEGGSDPMAILDAAREAMDLVGKRYEEGTYFLPELMLAGELMKQITGILKPELAKLPESKRRGGHPRHRQEHRGLYAGRQRLRRPRPGRGRSTAKVR
jgi:methanogenic corrinoid protein MtbC1